MASRSKFIPLENDTEGLGCADSSGPLGFLFALVTPLLAPAENDSTACPEAWCRNLTNWVVGWCVTG